MDMEYSIKSAFEKKENPVESQANHEGNESLLLIERVKDKIIQDQLLSLLHSHEQSEAQYLEQLRREVQLGRVKTETLEIGGETNYFFEEPSGTLVRVPTGPVIPQSYLELKRALEERIKNISLKTDINFSSEQPHAGGLGGTMSMNWELPSQGMLTTKQKSIIEAHEKGHVLRPFSGEYFRNHFAPGFDPDQVNYSQVDYEIDKREIGIFLPGIELSFEEAGEQMLKYLFSGSEIAERMNQLKNYFGFKGHERFTREHLDYAWQHYVRDTGMDNRMSHFLSAITSETEVAFLKLINESGI